MDLRTTRTGSRKSSIIAFVVAALLQLALAPQFSLFGGRFNFMVVFAVCQAVSSDPRSAVFWAFGAGLFYDFTAVVPVGLLTLILTLVCFLLASMSRGLGGGIDLASFRLAVVAVLVTNLLYGLFLFFLGSETSFVAALFGHGLTSSILDVLACVPFLMFGGGRQRSTSKGFGSVRSGGTRFKGLK